MAGPGTGLTVGRVICWMVTIPLVFLALYPAIYVMLPDSVAIRADLPQDLTVIVLVDLVIVPVVAAALFMRERRRKRIPSSGRKADPGARDAE